MNIDPTNEETKVHLGIFFSERQKTGTALAVACSVLFDSFGKHYA